MDPKAIPYDELYMRDVFGGRHGPVLWGYGRHARLVLATHIAPVFRSALHSQVHAHTPRSRGSGHSRCDLAPLTTSFGTVGQWERQHLAKADATSPEVVEWAPSV